MKAAGLLLIVLLAAGTAGAQDYLNCRFVPGWEPSGAKRLYAANNLFEYKDGGAEGYLSFGFVRMQGITCASGANTLDIDVSEMGDTDSAYGMFAANLDSSMPIAKIGMGGQVEKQSAKQEAGRSILRRQKKYRSYRNQNGTNYRELVWHSGFTLEALHTVTRRSFDRLTLSKCES